MTCDRFLKHWKVSYFKWLRPEIIYTSLPPDSGHWPMKCSRLHGLFLACRLLFFFFFFILSFAGSLVVSFLISLFQRNYTVKFAFGWLGIPKLCFESMFY